MVKLRVTCAPQVDDRLPYGTWETRYLTGVGRVQGLVEDEFKTAIGHPTSVTVWGFRRLSLMPGDPLFGQWHDSAALLPLPLHYDRTVSYTHLDVYKRQVVSGAMGFVSEVALVFWMTTQ